MTAFSQRSIRLAMLDGIKQEDERTEQRLSERLRIKTAQLFHLQRGEVQGIPRIEVARRIPRPAHQGRSQFQEDHREKRRGRTWQKVMQ